MKINSTKRRHHRITGFSVRSEGSARIASLALASALAGVAATVGALSVAARPALANTELDRRFSLETVGLLRSVDNMDGLFGDYILNAYKDYFNRQSRFVLQDLTRSDELLTRAKIPYAKIVQDREILAQLSRTTRSQTLIRTTVTKEGPQYRFKLEWLHAPAMDLLAFEEFTLQDRSEGHGFSMEEFRVALQGALDSMIRKLPFLGTVTGRDENSVTVNLGTYSGIKAGDTLLIGTIDDARRHPLLREVVDWRLSPIGRVVVDQVDEKIAFARVLEESESAKIARYQKVTQIIPKAVPDAPVAVREEEDHSSYKGPTIGWLGGSLWTGGFDRQFTSAASAGGRLGGGLMLGAQVEANIWLTREVFADLHLGWGSWSYGQKNLTTSVDTLSGASGMLGHYRMAMGYSYFVNRDLFGPKAWAKVGYQSSSFTLPVDAAEFVDSVSFSSLTLGIGGQLPIRNRWGATMSLDLGVFPSASETAGSSGSARSASSALFFLGGYYHYTPQLTVRAGIEVMAYGAEFSSGASLSQKSVTFAPSILYYF